VINPEKNEFSFLFERIVVLVQSRLNFWIGGGYAIDLFLGKITREHDDLDIVIKRDDQLHFQHVLTDWDLQAANPPGTGNLTPWARAQFLELPVHNIWCRKNINSPWDIELLFSEFEKQEWVYRRTQSIRGPIQEFAWKHESGLMVLNPVIQLLYKSRSRRPKDEQDLRLCLLNLNSDQKKSLKEWIIIDSGLIHPWIEKI
jgi:hypothetical protein